MSLDVYLTIRAGGEGVAHVYSANITHNLGWMAGQSEVPLYEALWRPEEIGATKAKDLVAPLRAGLDDLMARPAFFEQFNPKNGWGDYALLVSFTGSYLKACESFPDASVGVCR